MQYLETTNESLLEFEQVVSTLRSENTMLRDRNDEMSVELENALRKCKQYCESGGACKRRTDDDLKDSIASSGGKLRKFNTEKDVSMHGQAHGKKKNGNDKLNRQSRKENKSIRSKTQNERTNGKLNEGQNKKGTEHGDRKLSTPLIPNPLIIQLDDFENDLKAHRIEHMKKAATNNSSSLRIESENSTSTWNETALLFNALKRKVNDNSLEEKDIQLLFHDEDKRERRKVVVRRDVNALDTLIGRKLDLWNVENGGQRSDIPASEFESLMKSSGQKQFSQRSTTGTFNDEMNLAEDGLKEHVNQVEHIKKAGENLESLVDHIAGGGGLTNELVARDKSGLRDNWADVMNTVRALELLNNIERVDDAHNLNTFETNHLTFSADSLETSGHKNLGILSNEGLDTHTNEGVSTNSNGGLTNNQMWVDRFVNLDGQMGGPDELDRFKYSIEIGPVEDRHARHDIDKDTNEDTVHYQSPPNQYTSAETMHGLKCDEEINIGDAEELEASKESVESQSVVEQAALKQDSHQERIFKEEEEDASEDSPQEENIKEEEDAPEDSLQWTLSKHSIRDPSSLPGRLLSPYLFNSSFRPLFTEDGVKILYNDQTPGNKTTVSFGHSKGLLVGNSLGGIWVVHSVPHFVDDSLAEYSYPHTGLMYGQNLLCLTLNASTLDSVGSNLGVNQIYKYSTFMSDRLRSVYPTLASVIDGSFVPPRENYLVHDFSTSLETSEAFHSFAKTKELGQDLYKVIGDQLGVSLLVETWPNGPGRLRSDCRAAGHFVENVASIGAADVVSYRSTHDHAKWAISFGNQTTRTGKSFAGFGQEMKTKEARRAALGNENQTKTEPKDSKIQEALYEKANELDGSFESVFKRIEDLAALDSSGDNWRVDVNENSVELNEKQYRSSWINLTDVGPTTNHETPNYEKGQKTVNHEHGNHECANQKTVNHEHGNHESANAVQDVAERVDYWVCNGDINRAEDQLKRGGGSVCMNNKAVWTLYQGLINGVEPCPVQ
uniref:Deoxyribonuclease-2-alpha n=1 Tax=Cacopsylla melanoneura TaxID=428564 RepID=A0A8D8W1I2_9HEMI